MAEPSTQTEELKKVIEFGTKNALTGATPKGLKYFYRTLMFSGALWALVIQPQFPEIPVAVGALINKWILVSNAAVYQFCKFFGWVTPSDIGGNLESTKENK